MDVDYKFIIFLLLCNFLTLSFSLFEDQIGKFDWKQSYIGKLKFSSFDPAPNGKRLFVATEENVVAALNLKTGQILWRHVLEEGLRGTIHLMMVNADVVTISGVSPRMVRGWDPTTGVLQWEWTLPSASSESADSVWWYQSGGDLYQVTLHPASHVDVDVFTLDSGANVTTHMFPAPWAATLARCTLSAPYVMCLSTQGNETAYNALDCGNGTVTNRLLSELIEDHSLNGPGVAIETVPSSVPAAVVTVESSKYLIFHSSAGLRSFAAPLPEAASVAIVPNEEDHTLLFMEHGVEGVDLQAADLLSGDLLADLADRVQAEFPAPVSISAAACGSRKGRGPGCKVLFKAEDHSIALVVHPGKTMWVREEALASIIAVEMLDLPVSDMDAAIEQEFDHKETGFIGMFVHRIASQLFQLRSALLSVLGVGDSLSDNQRAGLVRDEFGLHKVIVAATAPGKVFGIDNLSGEVLWQHWLQDGEPFMSGALQKPSMVLYVQRTNRHFPKPAQCVLVLRSKGTGEGLLFIFNPITGQAVDGGLVRLGYTVKQTTLLHQPSKDALRGVLLLDTAGQLHVFPESARNVAASVTPATFLFTAEPSGLLSGYALALSSRQQEQMATPVWTVKLVDRITAIVGKSSLERVHSQGRVLGDRSVLYKYINPNLVAVVTENVDPVHKFVTSVYLLDVVSGWIVFSTVHRRARGPVHLVHSENWVVYTYFSEKFRRTELVALELYEGKVQSNTTAFSSVSTPLQPIVDRQAFILPASVQSMKETITEKGITSKHILVALANGWVLELPWVFVDPRRPSTVTPEMREEGVIPYMPELPIPSDAVVNYNQTLERVQGIYTSPSGLESTCLVLVYGLDLFYTRVAPSKTFDLLKEDFDYYLITVVLSALLVASYITKKLASKKALKQAWK